MPTENPLFPNRPFNQSTNQPLLLGAHFSIAGGLEKAVYAAADYGCTAVQLFTKNANTWKERDVAEEEVERFSTACRRTGIRHLASHTSYLINLAAPDRVKHQRSCQALCRELIRAAKLSIPFIETPKKERGKDWDRVNLDLLRSFVELKEGSIR